MVSGGAPLKDGQFVLVGNAKAARLLIDQSRWDKPFPVRLAVLDPFIVSNGLFGQIELEQGVAICYLVDVKRHIRQPNATMFFGAGPRAAGFG